MPSLYSAPRTITFVGEETGCSLWRTFWITAELQNRGYFAHFKSKDDPECLAPEWPYLLSTRFDAVILPRMAWSDRAAGDRYFKAMHAAGLAILYEVDDDAFSPSIVHRQYSTHESERDKGMDHLEQDRLDRIYCMSQCDGVTVTTPRLKTIVQQYTEAPVEVVPNAIDTRWWRSVLRGCSRVVPPLTIGWAGGSRYPEDLVPMAEAWARIARTDDSVRFVVQGHLSPVIAEAVPSERLTVVPWLPLTEYPRGLLNIDIGCCAVAPKLFNTAKTPIKLWELTMSGAVCVVSPTLYGPVAQDGEDALVAETADQWEGALRRLIGDRDMRRRLWRNQRRRVASEHSMDKNWWRWPRAWERIIEAYRAEQARPRLLVAS